ncbi:MAG: DUF5662 family protein [Omnitrophica bacterium]|nr:DUF5662 family protein [Candidatus Omnitrophota bacterium]
MRNDLDFLTDTILHISEVRENLEIMTGELTRRGLTHDRTKLQAFEFDAFVSTRDKFKKANYGSKEYQECVDATKPAIDHHYKHNSHHTGFHADGINGMTLIDIMEMVADWRAAARRSPDKTLFDTLDYCFKKYKIEKQLRAIIMNTLVRLKWIE